MNRSRPLQKPISSQNSEKKLNAGIPTLIYLSTPQLLPRIQETPKKSGLQDIRARGPEHLL